VDTEALRGRIEAHVRRLDLIPPGGAVTCLVSGGADSTCLWHALGALGYEVAALHVNHGLRGNESDEDARFCREVLGADPVQEHARGKVMIAADVRRQGGAVNSSNRSASAIRRTA